MSTRSCFEKEAKGDLEIGNCYNHLLFIPLVGL